MTHTLTTVTITLDPSQDIGDLEAGPVFSDEYAALALSDDPRDTDRLMFLDGVQEELVTDYLTAWSRVAARIADSLSIEMFLVIGSPDVHANDAFAEELREQVNEQVTVSGGGDAWFVTHT